MEYRRLGKTDLLISRIGFGCAPMGGYDYGKVRDEDSVAAVHKALDLGVNFFDTADVYGLGHAEELLGRTLEGQGHDVIIATKVGLAWDASGRRSRNLRADYIYNAVESSLQRLKIDCIPLYQIHWPDPETPLAETLEALQACQKAGKIRFIGCCNFPLDTLEEAQAFCRIESIQLPYSLAERRYENVLEQSWRRYEMAVLCYSVLAQGLFTGKYDRNSRFQGTDVRQRSELFDAKHLGRNLDLLQKLRVAAERHHRSPAQVAMRWALDQPAVACAITGVKKPEQIDENVGSAGWFLSAEDAASLDDSPAGADPGRGPSED